MDTARGVARQEALSTESWKKCVTVTGVSALAAKNRAMTDFPQPTLRHYLKWHGALVLYFTRYAVYPQWLCITVRRPSQIGWMLEDPFASSVFP